MALLAIVSMPLLAQTPRRVSRSLVGVDSAETAIKQAVDRLGNERRSFDRDIEVLRHLRAADDALADTMQPQNAIQKSFEEVSAAEKAGSSEFVITQGLIRTRETLDEARKSPAMADIGRLRGVIRSEALGPASRVAVRNASRLQDETVAWIRIQTLISDHLRNLSDVTSATLRGVEQ